MSEGRALRPRRWLRGAVYCALALLIALAAFALRPGPTLRGRVVTTEWGPVAGALVTVAPYYGDEAGRSWRCVTAADGSYEVDVDVDIPVFAVQVRAPEWGVQAQFLRDERFRSRLARMVSGRGGFEVVAPVSSATARAVTADGTPLSDAKCGVRVLVWDPDVGEQWHTDVAECDSDGVAVIPLPVDSEHVTRVTLDASAPGFAPATVTPQDPIRRQGGTTHYGPVDVTLEPTGVARGRVVDAGGMPVKGASVRTLAVGGTGQLTAWLGDDPLHPTPFAARAYGFGGWEEEQGGAWSVVVRHRGKTDAAGVFELTAPLPCRELWIVVETPTHPAQLLRVPGDACTVGGAIPAEGEIRLPAQVDPIRVRLVDEDGAGLGGVSVMFQDRRLPSGAQINSSAQTTAGDGWLKTLFVAAGAPYLVSPRSGHQPVEQVLEDGAVVVLRPLR